jgi:hypothetical protein
VRGGILLCRPGSVNGQLPPVPPAYRHYRQFLVISAKLNTVVHCWVKRIRHPSCQNYPILIDFHGAGRSVLASAHVRAFSTTRHGQFGKKRSASSMAATPSVSLPGWRLSLPCLELWSNQATS